MVKFSEIKTVVKAKGPKTTFYGNVNGEPVYISQGVREVFFVNEEGVQRLINAVGTFQSGDLGSAAEAGKASKPGHEYGRYDVSNLEADTEDDAALWVHRAGDSVLAYFKFER